MESKLCVLSNVGSFAKTAQEDGGGKMLIARSRVTTEKNFTDDSRLTEQKSVFKITKQF